MWKKEKGKKKKRKMEIRRKQMGLDCCSRGLRGLKGETDKGDNFTSLFFFYWGGDGGLHFYNLHTQVRSKSKRATEAKLNKMADVAGVAGERMTIREMAAPQVNPARRWRQNRSNGDVRSWPDVHCFASSDKAWEQRGDFKAALRTLHYSCF